MSKEEMGTNFDKLIITQNTFYQVPFLQLFTLNFLIYCKDCKV